MDKIWLSIILGILSLLALATGIALCIKYFKNLNIGNLKIGIDFIEIPGHLNDRIKLDFINIMEIEEFETYEYPILKIKSKQGIFIVEKNWMKSNEL